MILYINACVREDSRTKRLAEHLLSRLDGEVKEVRLIDTSFPKADADFIKKRDKLIYEKNFSDPLFSAARDFAIADTIVIAAPFWDLSFPAALKQYIEQINVVGITFYYTKEGFPRGLCKAKKLYYITTAGGKIYNEDYGYGYIKALSNELYGIKDTVLFKAEELDIDGADVETILISAENQINGAL